MRSVLFVISGPSGAGKGTLVKQLLDRVPSLYLSISATTRPARLGEIEGEHYFFLDKGKFKDIVAEDGFLEWAEVHGKFYGTLREKVLARLSEGRSVVLEIDVQGALQIREKLSGAKVNSVHASASEIIPTCLIFIMPPSLDVLRERLIGRGTEEADHLEERIRNAETEISLAGLYDHIIVNDELSVAVDELERVVLLKQQ